MAIPVFLGGICQLISFAAGKYILSKAAGGQMLGRLLILGSFICFFPWLLGICLRQRKQMNIIDYTGFTALIAGMIFIGIWFLKSAWTSFELWNSMALILTVWGYLVFGTITLKAEKFPFLSTALWMTGGMMACAGLAYQWPGRFIFSGIGMIWCGLYFWKDCRHEDPAQIANKKEPAGHRFISLDLLRGLIIMIMSIDHARSMILKSHPFEWWNSAVPQYGTDTAGFLTRGVTHLCAPGFFLLMGAGMILFAHSRKKLGWSNGKVMHQLALRGGLIVLFEILIFDPIIFGQPSFSKFGVLFGLGGSMIAGVLFIRLNMVTLLMTGSLGVLITQILPPFVLENSGLNHPVAYLLLVPQFLSNWLVLYPVFPWLSITLLGMGLGKALLDYPDKVMGWVLSTGVVFLVLFVAVRWIGEFGNFQAAQNDSWIAFFNVVKYPPSLVFTLLTLGVNCLLLCLFDRLKKINGAWKDIFVVFGQTALYFYFAHWFLYSAIGSIFNLVPANRGVMYLCWALGLILLYPVCKNYQQFKGNRSINSMWRMV